MNLLYITADETSHYVLVKDLSRLVSSQYNNNYHKKYFCQYCLHVCKSEEVLKHHLGRYKLHGAQRIKLPKVDDKKGRDKNKFTKIEYQLSLPFVIYADFESSDNVCYLGHIFIALKTFLKTIAITHF